MKNENRINCNFDYDVVVMNLEILKEIRDSEIERHHEKKIFGNIAVDGINKELRLGFNLDNLKCYEITQALSDIINGVERYLSKFGYDLTIEKICEELGDKSKTILKGSCIKSVEVLLSRGKSGLLQGILSNNNERGEAEKAIEEIKMVLLRYNLNLVFDLG